VRTVSGGYFREGAFAGARPGELFAGLTCVECGRRTTTWAAFRAHRRECPGDQRGPGAAVAGAGAGPRAEAA
jgi:hypothetical protein